MFIFQRCIEKNVEEISAPGPHSGPRTMVINGVTNSLLMGLFLPHGFHWCLKKNLQLSGVVSPYLGLVHTPKIRGVFSPPTGDKLPAPPG